MVNTFAQGHLGVCSEARVCALSPVNGYRKNLCWPAQGCEIRAASVPTPQYAPLHRWHPACPVGAAASWTAGTPKLGSVEPAEPGLVRSRRMLCVLR